MKKYLLLLCCLLLSACDLDENLSSDQKMKKEQEKLSNQANSELGLPRIKNFQEKRTLKQIIELRDTAISTTTYLLNMSGKYVKICDSIGYGIPNSTQYTNPMKEIGGYQSITAIPQADPNGLFSPSSSDGTWVMCIDPKDKQAKAVLIEPRIIVSPFPLNEKE
jgi:hypothetical protein